MKTFVNCAAQGDLHIMRVDALPKGAKKVNPVNKQFVVAHSETGHHHAIAESPCVSLYTTDDPMVSYLEVIEATEATETLLEHFRSYDAHETIKFPTGIFELRRQREYVPEGWRRVED